MQKLLAGVALVCLCLCSMAEASQGKKNWVMAPLDIFTKTMRMHFRAAPICWKQKIVPNRKTAELEIVAINKAARRFWPDRYEEARWRLMTLMLTEGGGNTKGKAKDPSRRSYGPLHIKYEEAVMVAQILKIGDPFIDFKKKGAKGWFQSRLKGNVKFGIECAAGYLSLCDDLVGNDWQRGLLVYKYGKSGFMKAMSGSHKKPLNSLPVWVRFTEMRAWIDCLKNQTEKGIDNPCQCMVVFAKAKKTKK